MKLLQKVSSIFWVTLLSLSLVAINHPAALADTSPQITIAQAKVTVDSQFISLYNNGAQDVDMASVALQYFNHYSLPSATTSKTIQLSGTLPAHSFYIINDGPLDLCYQASINSAALGFSTKAGLVQVLNLTQLPGGGVSSTTLDNLRWSSTVVSGVQTMPATPAFLQRQLTAGVPVPNGTWQPVTPKADDPCSLVTYVTAPGGTPVDATPNVHLLPGIAPTAVFITMSPTAGGKGGGPGIPASDKGLMSPVLTEVLPNPAPPLTDADGEFVELYNPNKVSFDLSGFKIQTESIASGTPHVYTIPDGTKVVGKGYIIFTSGDTSISLSNSGGQAWLLDPFNGILSKSDTYGSAKEGQSWALGNGKWYWSGQPTAGKSNVIAQIGEGGASTGTDSKSNLPSVEGASTSSGSNSSGSSSNTNNSNNQNKPADHKLSSIILLIIAVLALLYWAYEYRKDIANRIRQFRANRAARKSNRK